MDRQALQFTRLENKIKALEYRLSAASRNRCTSVSIQTAPPSVASQTMSDSERAAYKQQIKVLQEDFLQERSDRERMSSRVDTLQRQLKFVKQEHNKLECKLASLRNVYRALHTTAYGVPPLFQDPVYECDARPSRAADTCGQPENQQIKEEEVEEEDSNKMAM